MKNETVLYFCNSYLLMLDFYESLDEVLSDFYGKETPYVVEKLKDECSRILALEQEDKKKTIKEVTSNIRYLDVKPSEMENILMTIKSKI